jgi:hypothetical protein
MPLHVHLIGATLHGRFRSVNDDHRRFELSSEQIDALKGGAELAVGIGHENYQVEIRPVAEIIRHSLPGDLD